MHIVRNCLLSTRTDYADRCRLNCWAFQQPRTYNNRPEPKIGYRTTWCYMKSLIDWYSRPIHASTLRVWNNLNTPDSPSCPPSTTPIPWLRHTCSIVILLRLELLAVLRFRGHSPRFLLFTWISCSEAGYQTISHHSYGGVQCQVLRRKSLCCRFLSPLRLV